MSLRMCSDSVRVTTHAAIKIAVCIAAMLSAAHAAGSNVPTGLSESVLKEVRNPETLPCGTYSKILDLEAEGSVYGHQTGRQVTDPDASGTKSWAAEMDADKTGYLLYGPYLETKPGTYAAFFRLKLTEEPSDYVVARLDACASDGKSILAARDVLCTDVSQEGYTQIPLAFRHSGGRLECRVLWNQMASVAVDRVDIYSIEGAEIEPYSGVRRVPAPAASGKPEGLPYKTEPRPFPELFPKSPAPDSEMIVIDLTGMAPDRQLLVRTLQGIVNREKPRIYCVSNEQDRQWLEWMLRRGWVKSTQTAADAEELLARFGQYLKGLIVTDPTIPHSRNAATMLAALEDAAVASPRLAKKLPLPIIADLRGRWKTSAEVYRWAVDNLWPRMNHHVIACLWPENHELRDYLVANKVFICWIPGPIDGALPYSRPDEEIRIVEELLGLAPPNIPIMGYSFAGPDVGIGEFGGVDLFSQFGKFLVGSVQSGNLTVHSGVPVDEFRQAVRPAPALAKDKVYICFTMSDGDNLPVVSVGNWPQLWADKTRGGFPIGWTIAPTARILIPGVVDFYYSTATANDTFMAAVSGVGYCYPQSYGRRYGEKNQERVFDEFLRLTDSYMRKMDLRAVCPSLAGTAGIERYAAQVKTARAVFADYGRSVTGYKDATYISERGVPVFRAATSWNPNATRRQQVLEMVTQIREMAGQNRPAFLHVFICNWFWDIPAIKEVLERLGEGFIAVGPDELAELYTRYMAEERIQTTGLSGIAYFAGQKAEFSAALRNTSKSRLQIESISAEGLSRAAVMPQAMALNPGQLADVRVSGKPNGSEVRLQIKGDFGLRTESAPTWKVQREELAEAVPGPESINSLYLFEAESLNHQSGREVTDSAASGNAAWASPPPGKPANHLVFGPYVTLPPGRYLALFRIKRTGDGDGPAARLDVSTDSGNRELSHRDVACAELPVGQYRCFPVEFEHPGGAVETRVFWTGRSAICADFSAIWNVKR